MHTKKPDAHFERLAISRFEEIKKLRQQLQQVTNAGIKEVDVLRQQLDECQKELRDEMDRYDAANNALTKCQKDVEKYAPCVVENALLRGKLAECERERDYWERNANEMNAHWKQQLATVTAERDELVAVLNTYNPRTGEIDLVKYYAAHQHRKSRRWQRRLK